MLFVAVVLIATTIIASAAADGTHHRVLRADVHANDVSVWMLLVYIVCVRLYVAVFFP